MAGHQRDTVDEVGLTSLGVAFTCVQGLCYICNTSTQLYLNFREHRSSAIYELSVRYSASNYNYLHWLTTISISPQPTLYVCLDSGDVILPSPANRIFEKSVSTLGKNESEESWYLAGVHVEEFVSRCVDGLGGFGSRWMWGKKKKNSSFTAILHISWARRNTHKEIEAVSLVIDPNFSTEHSRSKTESPKYTQLHHAA
ncbi:hypothetical protein CC80DRAFT_174637 [Byssothecium circinans]|uniref:Uncharacterized protein n=1 Tax=Byssothecium circinans TaxID=147558 RepID=A0A6A5TJW7_9PLEO|nr:hypothetical protein CC80DRAFT_174637 [Byssothecium circinans]